MDTEYTDAPEQPTLPTAKGDWVVPFLNSLQTHGIVSRAAVDAKIHRDTAYHRRSIDPWFAEEWAKAVDRGIDMLEDVGKQRAYDGSDTLLIFMLKANRPKYRDTVRNLTINITPDEIAELSDDELDRLEAQLRITDRR